MEMKYIPVEEELIDRINWFVRLRWIAVSAVVLTITIAENFLKVQLASTYLYLISAIILVYNLIFFLYQKKLAVEKNFSLLLKKANRIANLQISLDLICLTLLLHFSGGVENPFYFYFLFHIIIGSILLSPRAIFLQTTLAVTLFGSLLALEFYGLIPHFCLGITVVGECLSQNRIYNFSKFFVFATTMYISLFMTTSISRKLKQRGEELFLEKEFVNNIIRDMFDSLIIFGPDCKIKMVNNSTLNLLGYKEEELLGQQIESLFAEEEDRKEFSRELFGQGHFLKYEIKFRHKNGELVPVSLATSILKTPHCPERLPIQECPVFKENRKHCPELQGFVSIARDLRETKKLQEQLIQSEKLASLGTLSAGVAHEIKNPLAIILQGLEYLKRSLTGSGFSSEGEALDVVERIKKATLRADKIVKDLLNFARQSPPQREEVDISSIIDESLSLVEYEFELKKIKIIKKYAPMIPKLKVDSNQMKQVFINLLFNALDALPEGGEIGIGVRPIMDSENRKIEIKIADNGCGIPQEELPKIFDPFFSTKKDKGGTGLGLSVTRGIIERHNGSIRVESQPGKGTTFILELPLE